MKREVEIFFFCRETLNGPSLKIDASRRRNEMKTLDVIFKKNINKVSGIMKSECIIMIIGSIHCSHHVHKNNLYLFTVRVVK